MVNQIQAKSVNNPSPMGPSRDKLTSSLDGQAKKIYQYIVGVDEKVKELTEVNAKLNDPFAKLIWKREKLPLTAQAVVDAFKPDANDQVEACEAFLIDESGQVPWEYAKDISRPTRIVFAIKIKRGIGPDVLINTAPDVNSDSFLEVMGWDPESKAYNFYQRLKKVWIWSGDSFAALIEGSRNKGPFSGHINGGPIMKELRVPWQHWNSSSALIKASAYSKTDPLVTNPHFLNKKGGEVFEKLTVTGIHFWNQHRLKKSTEDNLIKEPHYLLRQILDTTNVNLISSIHSSRSIDPCSDVQLPFSFFANLESLSLVKVNPKIGPIIVKGSIYLNSLKSFDFRLEEQVEKNKTVRVLPGDTHFVFFVPEVAFEDIDLLKKMIKQGIISKRLAACLLMVDFANPVYSNDRASLLKYVPPVINLKKNSSEPKVQKGNDLDTEFLNNIRVSNHLEGSPEHTFLSNWTKTEGVVHLNEVFNDQINKYFEKVQKLCETQEGFDQLIRLAESRRNRFRKTAQFEFDLTFSTTNISPQYLKMTSDGKVVVEVINGEVQKIS